VHTSGFFKRVLVVAACFLAAFVVTPRIAESSPASAAAKRAGAAMKSRLLRVARLDRVAHQRAAKTVLAAPRRVFRYVPATRARQEVQQGFARMSHFTTRAVRGRPLSALHAKKRYGLPQMPANRLTLTLGKGTPVKTLKAHGGAPGVGELVNTRRIPPTGTNMRVRPLQ